MPLPHPCPHPRSLNPKGKGDVVPHQGQNQGFGAGVGFQHFLVYPLVGEMRKMQPQLAKGLCQGPGTH